MFQFIFRIIDKMQQSTMLSCLVVLVIALWLSPSSAITVQKCPGSESLEHRTNKTTIKESQQIMFIMLVFQVKVRLWVTGM